MIVAPGALAWLPVAAAAAILTAGCGGSDPAATAEKTSVLWLTLCTLRADHLGAYGYGPDVSPNLDGLAERGVLFESVLAPAPWTRASMAASITGHYPRSLAIEEPDAALNDRRLHDQFETLAEDFGAAGLATIGVTANPNTNAAFGFDQGFDAYVDTGRLWREGYAAEKFTAEDMSGRFLALLDEIEGRPFFGHLTLVDVHAPLGVDAAAAAAPELSLGTPRGKIAAYDAMIRYTDWAVANLLAEVEHRGYRDLLVVITSDHGEGFGSPHRVDTGHGAMLYNSTIWVPLILWHSGERLPRGHRVEAGVDLTCLRPTLLELVGLTPPDLPGGGVSRASLARGQAGETPARVVETRFSGNAKSAIVRDGWKLILDYAGSGGTRQHLYRYAERPDERRDVAPDNPEVAAQLAEELEAWQSRRPPLVDAGDLPVGVSEETRKRLEGLGYVR